MPSRSTVIGSRVGLHARPASLFVQAATAVPAGVTIAKSGGDPVNAKSILMVLSLDARGGDEVTVTVDGDDAEAALDSLVAVLETDHDDAES